jgi:hypothetical protein
MFINRERLSVHTENKVQERDRRISVCNWKGKAFWKMRRCAQKEADLQIVVIMSLNCLAAETIMLCMQPLRVRMMQLASFTFSFT